MKPAAWHLLLLVAAVSGCTPPEQQHATRRREVAFQHLGAAITAAVPQPRVLVVGNPFTAKPGANPSLRGAETSALRGLKRGLGGEKASIAEAFPELKTGALENPHAFSMPSGATTPLSFLTAEGAWDRIREEHRDADVFLSLIGLPADLATTRAWTEASGPKWALFLPDLRLLGSSTAIQEAFERGRLLALLLNRPGAPPESEPPGPDPEADFQRRYLLITRENFTEQQRAWPAVFQ